jgi:hypothetical protein
MLTTIQMYKPMMLLHRAPLGQELAGNDDYGGNFFSFFLARQPLVGLGLLVVKALRSQSDTPHSVGLLWTSDQPDSETSTWQHTSLTRDRHSCQRQYSNPQSQQANCRRPTPYIARPPELMTIYYRSGDCDTRHLHEKLPNTVTSDAVWLSR